MDGEIVDVAAGAATTTVLDYLRDVAQRTGTKEGCAEGDCGACTVALGELAADGKVHYRAINSCIRFLPTIDGCELVTVESLQAPDGSLHPVQRALVETHASQCGFCTPGFVMSLFALYLHTAAPTRQEVVEALSGNLCRCTGYRPIIDAGLRMSSYPAPLRWSRAEPDALARRDALAALHRKRSWAMPGFQAPSTVDELATALEATPTATVLAGGTDIGLWVTKQLKSLPSLIYIGAIDELKAIRSHEEALEIGAAVPLAAAWTAIVGEYPMLGELAQRFGSPPVRNSGTLCGNLANGSPIGDAMPILIALGADLCLRRGARTRSMPLEDFYLGYRRNALARGEFVQSVNVPRARPGFSIASYKVAKRFDQDISAVCIALALRVSAGRIEAARVAFGGMAAVPARARAAEAALCGAQWSEAAFDAAAAALAQDFQPLSDFRASSAYRMQVAGGLLRRFRREQSKDSACLRTAQCATVSATIDPAATAPAASAESAAAVAPAPVRHESAHLHVSGQALYTDDIALPRNALHAVFGLSRVAHGRILELDLAAVATCSGVVTVASAKDVPGENNYGSVLHDDPIFADGLVQYAGQPLFAVAASSYGAARQAAAAARVDYERLPAILDIRAALAAQSFVLPSERLVRGEPHAALERAAHRVRGTLTIGGQDHFYLEGQIAIALPQENSAMLVHSSTQHPSEVQMIVARAIGARAHDVTVQCRRMGGGFGGKETQPALIAAAAAVLARNTGRPVKLRVDRDVDMLMTGKRHDFLADYEAGFDTDGRLAALTVMLASRCGYSADLSGPVNDRAMMHVDNAYYLEHVEIVSHRCKTHTVSNTAFRGFGGPQGMMVIEHVLDHVARTLGLEPLAVRRVNLYGVGQRNVTPYGQQVEDNVIPAIMEQLTTDTDYVQRRLRVSSWNAANPVIKRGLALTPVKFGISFTSTMFNQAGALVHVYGDGTVLLNHGGTEMGQGLFTKVAQVVASEFALPLSAVRVTTTDTSKVPNTSATAASAGADLNCKAAQAAARTVRERLIGFAVERYAAAPGEVRFAAGWVHVGERKFTFATFVQEAYRARISLSSTGFYRTPKIEWDKDRLRGRPFFYFAYGAALSEVAIDTLTGETELIAVDILHDAGTSLNSAIDIGQIEGGFLQGVGWLTAEELWWSTDGELKTHAPSTYKIPTVRDWPVCARVRLLDGEPNREDTIFRSKAVGEPPLMLAMSVFHAIRDAVAACGPPRTVAELCAPATPEAVLRAVERARAGERARP